MNVFEFFKVLIRHVAFVWRSLQFEHAFSIDISKNESFQLSFKKRRHEIGSSKHILNSLNAMHAKTFNVTFVKQIG